MLNWKLNAPERLVSKPNNSVMKRKGESNKKTKKGKEEEVILKYLMRVHLLQVVQAMAAAPSTAFPPL